MARRKSTPRATVIYLLTIDGCPLRYVGSTLHFRERRTNHLNHWRTGHFDGPGGRAGFWWLWSQLTDGGQWPAPTMRATVVEVVPDPRDRYQREAWWIVALQTRDRRYGFNTRPAFPTSSYAIEWHGLFRP